MSGNPLHGPRTGRVVTLYRPGYDEDFHRRLPDADAAEERVASILREDGFEVVRLKKRVRPKGRSPKGYGDQGDLLVGSRCRLVEVKSRDLAFESLASYPYPDVLVMASRDLDRARPTHGVVIVSQITGAMFGIPATRDRRHLWTSRDGGDPNRPRYSAWFASIAGGCCMRWGEFVTWLRASTGD